MPASRAAACGKPAFEFKNDLALLGHEGRHGACRIALGKAPKPDSRLDGGLPRTTDGEALAEIREELAELRRVVMVAVEVPRPGAAPLAEGSTRDNSEIMSILEEVVGQLMELATIIQARSPEAPF